MTGGRVVTLGVGALLERVALGSMTCLMRLREAAANKAWAASWRLSLSLWLLCCVYLVLTHCMCNRWGWGVGGQQEHCPFSVSICQWPWTMCFGGQLQCCVFEQPQHVLFPIRINVLFLNLCLNKEGQCLFCEQDKCPVLEQDQTRVVSTSIWQWISNGVDWTCASNIALLPSWFQNTFFSVWLLW